MLFLDMNSSISSTVLIISLDKLIEPFSVTKASSSILIPIFHSLIYKPGSTEMIHPGVSGLPNTLASCVSKPIW